MKGWHKHSREHALAARGIQMKANANFRQHRRMGDIDYSNPEQVFKAFWKASIENDWEEFDWGRAFPWLEDMLTGELERQGLLSDENMVRYIHEHGEEVSEYTRVYFPEIYEKYSGSKSDTARKELLMAGEIRKILESGKPYGDWVKTHGELVRHREKITLSSKIFLMDSIIHLEHDRGSAFYTGDGDYIDMDRLREEFDRQYRGLPR